MPTKLAWGVLFLVFNSWARDPFFPLHVLHCPQMEETEIAWRLLGVIGRQGHYDAWLLSPDGALLRRQPGDPLPGTAWRIDRIDALAVTLATFQDCQTSRRLALKGRKDDQDDLPVARAD